MSILEILEPYERPEPGREVANKLRTAANLDGLRKARLRQAMTGPRKSQADACLRRF